MTPTIENPSWGEKRDGAHVGSIADNSAVDLYTLKDEGIEVEVISYGARIVSIRTPDLYGKIANVVLGYSHLGSYIADQASYLGAAVRRYANRIASGRFSIGRSQLSSLNEQPRQYTLHGGISGFDRRVWSAQPFSSGVDLALESEHGDQGFPGNLRVRVRYSILPNALRIDYFSSTDQTTVVNLTNHTYFNLSGCSDTTILEDKLTIAADQFTPIDSLLIPTGKLCPVEGTPFDFHSPSVIGARIDSDHEQLKFADGYDHNFVLNGSRGELRTVARLSNPRSGRTVTVSTTEPGLHLYTGNFLDGTRYGEAQEGHRRRSGLCMETQHFPDSPHHPNFPSTELHPGQAGRSTTLFEFSAIRQ